MKGKCGGYTFSMDQIGSLPKAYNGCSCECHTTPGIKHVMACCFPTAVDETEFVEIEDIIKAIEKQDNREAYERAKQIEIEGK